MTIQPATLQPVTPQPGVTVTTVHAMIRATVDALPHHPGASDEEKTTRCDAALLAIGALRPRDPMEVMLATRIIVSHYSAMDNFRCAAERDVSPVLQLRYGGKALQLCRLMDAASREFNRRQCYPALLPMAAVPPPGSGAQSATGPAAQPAGTSQGQAAAAQPAQPAAAPPGQSAPQPPPARTQTPPAAAAKQPAPKPAPSLRQEAYAASLRPGCPPCPAPHPPPCSNPPRPHASRCWTRSSPGRRAASREEVRPHAT